MDSDSPAGGASSGEVRDSVGQGAPAPAVRCRRCGQIISAANAFCPHCGSAQYSGSTWFYHPVTILVLAFVAIGPFALPLVWKSRRMGRSAKLLMAFAIVAYSAVCIYLTYKLVSVEWRELNQLNDVLQHINRTR